MVVELFLTEDSDARHPKVVAAAAELGVVMRVVSDHVASVLSETRTPQGMIAVCTTPATSLTSVLATKPRLAVVLVGVADPGNAGTVIRVADAAGADAVVFAGTTVDPYNGKCVRASTGSIFHLPVVRAGSAAECVDAMRAAGVLVLAADSHADADLYDEQVQALLDRPTAWFMGHEVRGLAAPGGAPSIAADRSVRIPIFGRAESLNLATAAAVCLYESARAHSRSG